QTRMGCIDAHVSLPKTLPAGGTKLTVSDTGVGMHSDQIGSVLRPFEQLDSRYSRSRNGTGLGLAIVNGWIALHNGRIEIKSVPGKGASFIIRLPPQVLETA
ncbi:MAG: ATP-binding protein, partial [Rhodospirillaceae bacterium]